MSVSENHDQVSESNKPLSEDFQKVSEGVQKASEGIKLTVLLDPESLESLKRLAKERKTSVFKLGGLLIKQALEGKSEMKQPLQQQAQYPIPKKVKIVRTGGGWYVINDDGTASRVYPIPCWVKTPYPIEDGSLEKPEGEVQERKKRGLLDYLTIGMFGILVFFAGLLLLALIIPYLP
jgi:hypothetical protein